MPHTFSSSSLTTIEHHPESSTACSALLSIPPLPFLYGVHSQTMERLQTVGPYARFRREPEERDEMGSLERRVRPRVGRARERPLVLKSMIKAIAVTVNKGECDSKVRDVLSNLNHCKPPKAGRLSTNDYHLHWISSGPTFASLLAWLALLYAHNFSQECYHTAVYIRRKYVSAPLFFWKCQRPFAPNDLFSQLTGHNFIRQRIRICSNSYTVLPSLMAYQE